MEGRLSMAAISAISCLQLGVVTQMLWRFMLLLSVLATVPTHRMEKTQRATVAMLPAAAHPNMTVWTSRAPSEDLKCLRAKGRG